MAATFTVQVYQGSDLITSWEVSLTTSAALSTHALDAAEKALITDPTALRASLVANERQAEVAWLDLRTPTTDGTASKTRPDALETALTEMAAPVISTSQQDASEAALAEAHLSASTVAVIDAITAAVAESQTGTSTVTVADALALVWGFELNAAPFFRIRLAEGATTIAEWDVPITADLGLLTHALDAGELALIGDPANFTCSVVAHGQQVEVAWLDVRTPLATLVLARTDGLDLVLEDVSATYNLVVRTALDILEAVLADAGGTGASFETFNAADVVAAAFETAWAIVANQPWDGARDPSAAELGEAASQDGVGFLGTDVLYLTTQEAMAGTATGTTLDAIAAILAEQTSVLDVGTGLVTKNTADVLALFTQTVHATVGTVQQTEYLETVCTAILLGSSTVTTRDVAAAILADALSGVGTGASTDTVAAALADAYTIALGLLAYTTSDTLEVAFEEVADRFLTLAHVQTDRLAAMLADRLAGTATVTTTDNVLASLADAARVDGAVTAADALPVAMAAASSIPIQQASADELAIVIRSAGGIAGILTLRPFKVGVLVATWPTQRLVHKTTGWPYTLVQKAA